MSRRIPLQPSLSPLILTALCALMLAPAAFAGPPEATLTAEGVSRRDVRKMDDPVVIDRAALKDQLDALDGDLKTFERMLDLVRDRRERKALTDQLAAVSDRLAALRAELRDGAEVEARRRDIREDRRDMRDDRRDRRPPPPVAEVRPQAMTGAQLTSLSNSLRQASFRKDKMRVIRLAAPENWFTTAQVKQIVEHFSFSSDKVDVLAMLHPRLIDPENTHTLFNLLPHASDRRKLEERIAPGK